jgi:beta-phosphoglucomutase-like phosphatase (HAD superfamily)
LAHIVAIIRGASPIPVILQAVVDLGLDPSRCVIVDRGDKVSDIEAGAAARLGLRILLAGRHAH